MNKNISVEFALENMINMLKKLRILNLKKKGKMLEVIFNKYI